MELLLKLISRPFLVALGLGIMLGAGWVYFGHIAKAELRARLYPPQRQEPSAATQDIVDSLERTARKRFEMRYRKVSAKIDEARAGGLNVRGMQEKADAALVLNNKQFRRHGLLALADVEMRIPRKPTRYIPASLDPEPEKIQADVRPGRKVPAGRRR